MIMFRREFKNNVKNEMMKNERVINDFREMIEQAMNLNDRLYERVMKKRYHEKNFEKTNSYSKSSLSIKKSRYQNNLKHVFMKLNATQQRKRKNLRSKQQEKNKTKTCYSCDKSSHFARDCRSKNLMI